MRAFIPIVFFCVWNIIKSSLNNRGKFMKKDSTKIKFLAVLLFTLITNFAMMTSSASAWSDNQPYWNCTSPTIRSQATLYYSNWSYAGFVRLYGCSNGYMFASASRTTYGYLYAQVTRSGSYPNTLWNSRNGYGTQTNMLYRTAGSCIYAGASAGRWASTSCL